MTKCLYKKFAEVYDLIMDNKFYSDYYTFIVELIKKLNFKPKNILELACGTGKLAKIFLSRGYNIEGLDLSDEMLKIAKSKGLKVYKGNIINFRLRNKYDLIVCAFDSLNYIQKKSDLQKCFNSVNRHLNQNGLFIFDMNSDFKIKNIIPKFKTKYYKIGKYILIWLNSHKKDKWIAEIILFEKLKDRIYKKFYERHIERAYRIDTIKDALKKAKFKIISTYSDFKFNKIRKDSLRWFFICKKMTN
jgi:ubiquinone/menaquinone biosynthesis C-methylase UbiE